MRLHGPTPRPRRGRVAPLGRTPRNGRGLLRLRLGPTRQTARTGAETALIEATSAGIGGFMDRTGLSASSITVTTAAGVHAVPLSKWVQPGAAFREGHPICRPAQASTAGNGPRWAPLPGGAPSWSGSATSGGAPPRRSPPSRRGVEPAGRGQLPRRPAGRGRLDQRAAECSQGATSSCSAPRRRPKRGDHRRGRARPVTRTRIIVNVGRGQRSMRRR